MGEISFIWSLGIKKEEGKKVKFLSRVLSPVLLLSVLTAEHNEHWVDVTDISPGAMFFFS